MKIAFVWNAEPRLAALSFRFEHYLAGFEQLGHEALMVCEERAAEGVDYAVETVPTRRHLRDGALWERLQLDVAVVITWHRMARLLEAIRSAGTRVIAISDSDGLVGLRAHPWMTLMRMIVYKRSLRSRLGCVKYWLGRYLFDGLTGAREDRAFLASTRASDVVIFGSAPAADAFRHFLRFHGEEALGERLAVVPYAVPEMFCDLPLPAAKEDRIMALGRWSDPQKDSGLLATALARYLEAGRPTRVAILGFDAEPWFGQLAARFPAVELLGPQPPDVVTRTLSTCRAIVFASRWETGPHAATEALALGTTLVGAPIPNLLGMAEDGRFGTVAQRRSPRALAAALEAEMAAWDAGRRDHQAIADHWRQRLRPASICSQLLAALDAVH